MGTSDYCAPVAKPNPSAGPAQPLTGARTATHSPPTARGRSSVGRASRSQREGQGFDSPRLHHPLPGKPGSMNARGGNAAVPGRWPGPSREPWPGDARTQEFWARFADRLCRPVSSAITFRPIRAVHWLIDQAKRRTRRCSAHDTGRSRIRFSRLAVSSMGWRPARMASTMSGARRPSGRIRLTSP